MKESTVKALSKIVAYTLVALWFIKRWYSYASKGHLLYDFKLLFRREKQIPELNDEFAEHYEEIAGNDGEACRIKRPIERLISNIIPAKKPDVLIYSNIDYRTEVNIGNGISTKIMIMSDELYPMPAGIYSILKNEKEFKRLLSSGTMTIKSKEEMRIVEERNRLLMSPCDPVKERQELTTHKMLI